MRRTGLGLIGGIALAIALLCGAPSSAAISPPTDASVAADREILVLLRLPAEHFRPNSEYAGSYGAGSDGAARRRIAARIASKYGLALVSSWPMPLLGVDCFVLAAPPGKDLDRAVASISGEPEVLEAQPVHRFRANGGPAYDDPFYPAQPAAKLWRLSELHQIATGRGVKIAVIDSKIDVDHPDLKGRVDLVQDFLSDRPAPAEDHGTGVAAVIAAAVGNRTGIVGVAPDARVMGLRACKQEPDASATFCDSLALAKALHFAVVNNAQIINLSLSGPQDVLLGRLIEVAVSHGITVVAAVDPHLPQGGFPSSEKGVIAVSDEPVPGRPDAYLAPGRGIPTARPGGRWYFVDGSSYAAAHVSGLFALMRERTSVVRKPLLLASDRPNAGAIDACATLLRLSLPMSCGCCRPEGYSTVARQ